MVGMTAATRPIGSGNLLDAERRVFLQHADRLGAAVGMIDILAGVVVLNHLVFHHAHAGLLDRHFGQRNTRLVGRHRRLKEDVIHLFLREFRKFPLCLAHEGSCAPEALPRNQSV